MYAGSTVGVVVPAYNEEGLVGTVIETIPSYVDRVYVVEDASTDRTWEEIQRTARRVNERENAVNGFDRRVVPIKHDENRGVGGAIKTGYLAARDDEIDVTAGMGGDAQMKPELLEGVIRPIVDDDADYAKGNRLLDDDHHDSMPPFRYLGNRILTWLTRIASGYWTLGDPQNGYTAISLHALETAGVEEMYEYYGYCNDLLVRLNVAGLRVVDVPRPAHYGEEESHIRYRSYIPRVSVMLLRGFLRRLWTKHVVDDPHPMVAFYGMAAATGTYGLLELVRSDEGLVASLSTLSKTLLLSVIFLLGGFELDRSHEAEIDGRWDTEQSEKAEDDSRTASAPAHQD